jgi:hypothetical protein
MRPCTRPAYFLLKSLALVIFLAPGSVLPSFAKPIPLPLPLIMADYSPSPFPTNRSFGYFGSRRDVNLFYSTSPVAAGVRTGHDLVQRDSLEDPLTFLTAATSNANDLRDLAARSSSVDDDDFDFQRDCAELLSSFSTNMGGFTTAFTTLASGSGSAGKGLANYDKTNDLETMLKNAVNLNKQALSATDVLVYNLPGVGPTLGPIVYQIKCFVDELLDVVENFTDGTLNQLQPVLASLLGKAVSTTCNSGVHLLGLCI